MKPKYIIVGHGDDEPTTPAEDVHEHVRAHLKSRGFAFVLGKDGRPHCPHWLLELVRVQERRGDAGGTVDWEHAWERVYAEPDTRRALYVASQVPMTEHGLNREHADEAVIMMLRHLAPAEGKPTRPPRLETHIATMKAQYEVELARQEEEKAGHTDAARRLHVEQTAADRPKYSEADLQKEIDLAVKAVTRKKTKG